MRIRLKWWITLVPFPDYKLSGMRSSFPGGANIILLWNAGFIPISHSRKEEGLVTLLTKHINYMTLPCSTVLMQRYQIYLFHLQPVMMRSFKVIRMMEILVQKIFQ